jgi:hypothetical protein
MRIFVISLFVAFNMFTQLHANDRMDISVGKGSFAQFKAENLQFNVQLENNALILLLKASSLELPEPIGQVERVSIKCEQLISLKHSMACKQGSMAFKHAQLGEQHIKFEFDVKPNSSDVVIRISDITVGAGRVNLDVKQINSSWVTELVGSDIQLDELKSFVTPFIPSDYAATLLHWSTAGLADFSAVITGQNQSLHSAKVNLKAHQVNISDSTSQHVTEQVDFELAFDVKQTNDDWSWKITSQAKQGQVYSEPIFIDFSDKNMALKAEGIWLNHTAQLQVNNIVLNQLDSLVVQGSLTTDFTKIHSADIRGNTTDLSATYLTWLQPYLTKTTLNDLSIKGAAQLDFQIESQHEKVALTLNNVDMSDKQNRFDIEGVSGVMAWTGREETLASSLQWQGGHLYSIPFGESIIKGSSANATFTLDREWVLPILDGTIQMNHFKIHRTESNDVEWSFNGVISPISMSLLSEHLAWPKLNGKLSGMIPNVSYKNKTVGIDGALMVKLFDGITIIRDMQLSQPFGILPKLSANVDLSGLDLETLTSEFDFGKITGKLNGHIHNLRLVNWQPVGFDAQFATPDNDESKHRISQRAVDNLTEVGGGASGMLSRSFLGFFEDFSYQKIGINCRLVNDVCFMSGVERADPGYYIVKGGGLPPRINVMGYTERVDWPELIERLKSVSQSDGPVIQ